MALTEGDVPYCPDCIVTKVEAVWCMVVGDNIPSYPLSDVNESDKSEGTPCTHGEIGCGEMCYHTYDDCEVECSGVLFGIPIFRVFPEDGSDSSPHEGSYGVAKVDGTDTVWYVDSKTGAALATNSERT